MPRCSNQSIIRAQSHRASVEERRLRSAIDQCVAERREWREADAAGDHPRLTGRIDGLERTAKRSKA